MIAPLSQPQRIDRKHFRALFRTPTTLQPLPPILHHVRGSLEYNNPFRKNSSTAVTFSIRFFPLL